MISFNREDGWVAAELEKTWAETRIVDVGIGMRYMRSLYWGITTLTMVGYGDITPGLGNAMELGYTILVLMMGGCIFAVVISNLEEVVAQADISSILYQRKLEEIKRYMKFRKLPISLKTNILQYYNSLWLRQKAVDTDHILEFVPNSVRVKLVLWQTQPILEKVPFIKDWKCYKEVAELLRSETFFANELVFAPDQVSEHLYLMVEGRMQYLSKDMSSSYNTFLSGDCVGAFQFFKKILHPCACKAIETSHVFLLSHGDFEMIMSSNSANRRDYCKRYCETIQEMSRKSPLASISKNLASVSKMTACMEAEDVHFDFEQVVFLPQSNFHRGWSLWLLLATIYIVFAISYRLAFVAADFGNTDTSVWLPIDVLVDVTFAVDIVLRLRVFAVVDQGVLVNKRKDFAKLYRNAWLMWDMISVVPIDYFLLSSSAGPIGVLLWTRANRLLRVLHVRELVLGLGKALEERGVHVTSGIKQLLQLLLLVVVAVHGIACVRFSILRTEGRLEDTDQQMEDDASAQYVRCFYYALYTITTVGYGSQSVDSNPQAGFAIVSMVIGTFLCDAGVTATLSNLILNEDIKEGKISRSSQCLRDFFKRQEIDGTVRTRIEAYSRYTLTTKRDLDEGCILGWLPAHLRTEVNMI
jgi:hypothetical protein